MYGKLYVVGGYDGEGFLNTPEEYFREQNCWKAVVKIRPEKQFTLKLLEVGQQYESEK